jgi:hypothetical protein
MLDWFRDRTNAHLAVAPIPQFSPGDPVYEYVGKICGAIGFAWNTWRAQAYFANVAVNGHKASGGPGCLKLLSAAAKSNQWEQKLSTALANTFSDAWKEYGV